MVMGGEERQIRVGGEPTYSSSASEAELPLERLGLSTVSQPAKEATPIVAAEQSTSRRNKFMGSENIGFRIYDFGLKEFANHKS